MADAAGKQSFSLAAYGRLIRSNRNFRLLWCAQIVSEIGDWLYAVAIYSLLLELTGSAKAVGLAIVLQILPQVIVSPAAGVLNDRLSRRSVMIFADAARVFIVSAMLLVTSADRVWLVWILLLMETVMWALFEPGRSAVIPNICRDPDETLVANALSSTTWAVNFALGAGLGGLVAYKFGRDAVFVLNALSFVVSAMLVASMRFDEPHAADQPPLRAKDLVDFSPVVEGFHYVRRDPRMLVTMSVKAGMGLMGAHWVILPVYGERIFRVGTDAGAGTLGISLLLVSRGVGSLIGSFASGWWAENKEYRLRTGIVWGFLLGAVSYMGLGGAPTLWLACLAVMAGHAGSSMNWVFSTTLLQGLTEDRFRGRVFSADFAGLFLLMSAVSYVAGVVVDWGVSVRTVAFVSGLLGFVPAALWLWAQRFWRAAEATDERLPPG
jgi:MFS family permease